MLVYALVRRKEMDPVVDGGFGFPKPHYLIIEKLGDADFFLYRFLNNGRQVGDTWHPSLKEAMSQAEYEYRGDVQEWTTLDNPDKEQLISTLNKLTDSHLYSG